jgi:hypothetical protein
LKALRAFFQNALYPGTGILVILDRRSSRNCAHYSSEGFTHKYKYPKQLHVKHELEIFASRPNHSRIEQAQLLAHNNSQQTRSIFSINQSIASLERQYTTQLQSTNEDQCLISFTLCTTHSTHSLAQLNCTLLTVSHLIQSLAHSLLSLSVLSLWPLMNLHSLSTESNDLPLYNPSTRTAQKTELFYCCLYSFTWKRI